MIICFCGQQAKRPCQGKYGLVYNVNRIRLSKALAAQCAWQPNLINMKAVRRRLQV